MDLTTFFLLGCTVLAASGLQAATGIGYGVIAGPVLLVVLNDVAAVQISTLHNLMIAFTLVPVLRMHIDRRILRGLIVGSILGIAVGFFLQITVSTLVLKTVAMLMLGFVTLSLVRDMMGLHKHVGESKVSPLENLSVGTIAGIMGGMLAMPGPVAGTWMSLRGAKKLSVRATILAFFIFAYGANTILYAVWFRFDANTLGLAAALLPALGLGIFFGNKLSGRVSESTFRVILLFVLITTLALLMISVVSA